MLSLAFTVTVAVIYATQIGPLLDPKEAHELQNCEAQYTQQQNSWTQY